MKRWVLMAAVLMLILLAGMAAAEPQPVDSDWQRSDDVPAEIATPEDAPPETAEATEEEAAADSGGSRVLLAVLAATCLIGLAAAGLWVRRTWRARR